MVYVRGNDIVQYLQMSHAFRNDLMVGHELIGRNKSMTEKTLHERYLLGVGIVGVLIGVQLRANLVELLPYKL